MRCSRCCRKVTVHWHEDSTAHCPACPLHLPPSKLPWFCGAEARWEGSPKIRALFMERSWLSQAKDTFPGFCVQGYTATLQLRSHPTNSSQKKSRSPVSGVVDLRLRTCWDGGEEGRLARGGVMTVVWVIVGGWPYQRELPPPRPSPGDPLALLRTAGRCGTCRKSCLGGDLVAFLGSTSCTGPYCCQRSLMWDWRVSSFRTKGGAL